MKKEREEWIDMVKGAACLVVFLDHFLLSFGYNLLFLGPLAKKKCFFFLWDGNWSVCVFLIISGYLTCNQILKMEQLDEKKLMLFSIRRYFRLFFPILFVSAVTYFIYKCNYFFTSDIAALNNNEWISAFFSEPLTFIDLIKSSIYKVLWSGDSSFNGPFWMLQYLFKGTFLALILALVIRKNRYGMWVNLFAILVFFMQNSYYLCIVLGVTWSYLKERTDFFDRQNRKGMELLMILVCISSLVCLGYVKDMMKVLKQFLPGSLYFCRREFWNTLGAFVFLITISVSGSLKRIIQMIPAARFFGKNNFGIYLVHWPLMSSVVAKLYLILRLRGLGIRMCDTITFIICFAVTLVLSVLYTNYFENGLFRYATNIIAEKYAEGIEDRKVGR